MAMQYRGNVVVLDDGTGTFDDLAGRVRGIFPDVFRLTADAPADRHDLTVERKRLGVKTLVRTMVKQDAYWGLLPKHGDPVAVIADYLSAARPALADGFPAFVLVAAAPGVRYQRIAIVADVREPVTTGILALTGVGLACHLGCSLDVLLLGARPDAAPTTWADIEDLLDIRAGAQDLERALTKARADGLTVNWVPLGDSGERDARVLDAVRERGYDLVLDDLRPIDVGTRIGRLKRVEQQLLAGQTDTAYRLLRDAPCDVAIVVDAVTMNMMPASAVTVGAVAALSIGMVGSAVQPAPDAHTAATMATTAEAAPSVAEEAVAAVEAQAEGAIPVAPPAVVVTTPPPAADSLPGTVSRADYDQYRGTFEQARAEAAAAQAEFDARVQHQAALDQAVVMAQADLALQRRDTAAAQATVDSARDRYEYSQSGRDRLSDAEEARALGSRNASERDLQRQRDHVATAEAALAQARTDAAAAAEAVAAQQPTVDAHNANIAGWDAFLAEADARTPKVVSPMPGHSVTTGYGVGGGRWSSGRHTGIDFAAPSGTRVVAVADGVVTFAGRSGPYGNRVEIRHADGTTTSYSHLSSIGVSTGTRVGAGQRIGGVGSTGNSTGPHLHFEVMNSGGGFVNPSSWLSSRGAL